MSSGRLILMGRIKSAFGLGGELKCLSYALAPGVFLRSGVVWLGADEASARPKVLEGVWPKSGDLVMAFKGVETKEDAMALRGQGVFLRAEDLDSPKEDEFFWFELFGAEVKTAEGHVIGRLKAIAEIGPQDMLVVEDGQGREGLFPMADEMIKTLDPDKGLVVLDLPPGILEAQGFDEPDWDGE